MHDGITFEQHGKPAAVLCTRPFVVTAKNIARVMGLPDYPFVVLDHPLGSLRPEEVRSRAGDACVQAVTILTQE